MNLVRHSFRRFLGSLAAPSVLKEHKKFWPREMDLPAATNGAPPVCADGEAPEKTDYANYFCTYAYLYHQVKQPIDNWKFRTSLGVSVLSGEDLQGSQELVQI